MTKKNQRRKRKKAKKEVEVSFERRLKEWWRQKNPAVMFILLFFLVMGLFYGFYTSDTFKENIHPKITAINAYAGSTLLNIFGYGTTVAGADISNSQFSVTIKRGCDALEPIALLIAIMIAFPVTLARKLPGLVFGTLTLLFVNIIRVATLFIAGLYSYEFFDTMHVLVWQFLFILITLVCCAVWINWATKQHMQEMA